MSRSRIGTTRIRFFLERWVQRGLIHQLVLMAAMVAAVALFGGLAAWSLTDRFDALPAAIWWSFLRLTDPGYLGDDEGATLRVLSTAVTVLGYVLFMGSLIAILTQWLTQSISKLEGGFTPLAMENHFVILGWTNRTPEIVRRLLTAAGRMERFLSRRTGSDKLRIAILLDEVDAARRVEIKEKLGEEWDDRVLFLRSGSSLEHEHLERLDLPHAAVVMIPGADFELGGAGLNDARVIKTVLSVDALLREAGLDQSPCLVAELFDPRRVDLLDRSTDARTEIIAGDRLLGRLLSQSLRHPAVGEILSGLMSHREGNGVYLRSFEALVGQALRSTQELFEKALVLGRVTLAPDGPEVQLNPKSDVRIEADDKLILLAPTYRDCEPRPVPAKLPVVPVTGSLPPAGCSSIRRFLILGWSNKVPTLLSEIRGSTGERFEVTLMSRVGVEEREHLLGHLEDSDTLEIRHVVGDYSLEQDLRPVMPQDFDQILLLASGWMDSSEEADARSIMGLLVVRSLLAEHDGGPGVLVELLSPENALLVGKEAANVFVSPRLLSHLIAHVGLLPELNVVLDALICSGGSEISLRPPHQLGLDQVDATFADIQEAAAGMRCVALGFYTPPGPNARHRIELNPNRTHPRTLGAEEQIIVLTGENGTPS